MSSCPLKNDPDAELSSDEQEFKKEREYYLRQAMRGTIRAALLPLAMSSGDFFAPIDIAAGIDRRDLLIKELDEFKLFLRLSLEDTYGEYQDTDRSGVPEDQGCPGCD